jgi:hypothetical protein
MGVTLTCSGMCACLIRQAIRSTGGRQTLTSGREIL